MAGDLRHGSGFGNWRRDGEAKPLIATKGPWWLIAPDAVWDAYHDPVERLHRYVPAELIEHERVAYEQPELIRDELRRRVTA